MIPSETLRNIAAAVERFEKADEAMRSGWPRPSPAVIEEWNVARDEAEKALGMIYQEIAV
jgi:hypothetical protein